MRSPSPSLGFLWRTTTLRHARHSWRHTATVVAILALGVAAFLSIRMANRAAVVSFAGFSEAVSGGSDLSLTAPAGLLDAALLGEMRAALGAQPGELIPLLRGSAAIAAAGAGPAADSFIFLGLDLVAMQNLHGILPGDTERFIDFGTAGDEIWTVLRSSNRVFVSAQIAAKQNLKVGGTLRLLVGDQLLDFVVAGVLPKSRGTVPVPANLLVTDIAALQQLIEEPGRITQVDLLVPQGPGRIGQIAAARAALEAAAMGRWILRDPMVEIGSGERMTASFRTNLTVLSLIALLVGVYLVTQALDAAVVRRRHEIAILRSLGLTVRELRRLWLFEIIALGLAGSVFGILLGWGLAQITVVAVARTVNALYQTSSATAAGLTTLDAALGLALGLGFSLFAGWLPLRDAAATPPAQILAAGNWTPGLRLLRRPLLGAVMLLAGLGLRFLPPLSMAGGSRFPLAGYAAALLWLLGGTLVATCLFPPLARLAMRLCAASPALHLGATRLRRASSRHQLAAAGLFVATAMAASMAILVGSFDKTVRSWIDVRFQADVYLTSAGAQGAGSLNRIREATWRELESDPRVAAIDVFLALPIELNGVPTYLGGADLSLLGTRQHLLWLGAPPSRDTFLAGAPDAPVAAIANEAFLTRFARTAGDLIEVPTPQGPRTLRIAAVQADYGNEQGSLTIDRSHLVSWFGTAAATNLSVFLSDPGQAGEVVAAWQSRHPGLNIRSNRELRAVALEIFQQTFAITRALELISVFIALVGLALALTNILRESIPELETLRQLGMRRSEIAAATAVEGTGIALVGLTGGLLLSLAFGHLLVFVINKQSFGWTLQFAVPGAKLATLAIIILLTGAATAFLTGLRANRLLHPSSAR
jgi:putative ABC transport system permease protein